MFASFMVPSATVFPYRSMVWYSFSLSLWRQNPSLDMESWRKNKTFKSGCAFVSYGFWTNTILFLQGRSSNFTSFLEKLCWLMMQDDGIPNSASILKVEGLLKTKLLVGSSWIHSETCTSRNASLCGRLRQVDKASQWENWNLRHCVLCAAHHLKRFALDHIEAMTHQSKLARVCPSASVAISTYTLPKHLPPVQVQLQVRGLFNWARSRQGQGAAGAQEDRVGNEEACARAEKIGRSGGRT